MDCAVEFSEEEGRPAHEATPPMPRFFARVVAQGGTVPRQFIICCIRRGQMGAGVRRSPAMKFQHQVIIYVIVIGVIAAAGVYFSRRDGPVVHVSEENRSPAEPPRIDLGRPLFTTRAAIVCPGDALFDIREGYGYPALRSLYTSVLNLEDKERRLGCMELREGVPVYRVERLREPYGLLVQFSLDPRQEPMLLTAPSHLRN